MTQESLAAGVPQEVALGVKPKPGGTVAMSNSMGTALELALAEYAQ